MSDDNFRSRSAQRGMVLITTLLLLVVVTILALAMFRSVGIENIIAGNVLDKQRAVQNADSAQVQAEQWLLQQWTINAGAVPAMTDCASNPQATTTALVICINPLDKNLANGEPATVPWTIGTVGSVGYGYNPSNDLTTVSANGGVSNADTVYGLPTAYIGALGTDGSYANAEDYRVDAWAYGGSDATVAVVESTYQVRLPVRAPGP